MRLDDCSCTTALYRLAGSYSFTPRLYLQANVQYSDDTENLGTNIRLGWLDTAGTGLFIVYNESYNSSRSPGQPRSNGREAIVKLTWLFQF